MNNAQIKQQDQTFITQTYARFDLALSHGKGCEVWDFDGKKYLDFTSGIGTNSLGWANEHWLAAVTEQAGKLQHTSNLYYSQPAAQLAEKLCVATGLKNVFFCNSGAEANEGAIKAARKYSLERYGEDRFTILTLTNSFHGRTITTLAATGQTKFHQHFFPFTQGFEHLNANDITALEKRLKQNDVCAIMLEVVQGEGGVLALEESYLQQVVQLCHKQDVLLILDEVQTGIGRTGKLFAYQHFGLQPDIVTLAKGLGGGLPIGAIMFGEKCSETLRLGDHGSTFGGNPVCCAAANSVVSVLNEDFLAEIDRKSMYLRQALSTLPQIKSISGLGLMIGIEFTDITAQEVALQAMQKGVLFLTAKHKLRLLPPLIITEQQIDQAINVLKSIL